MKLPCTYCHEGAVKAERAALPAPAKCDTCHTGKGYAAQPSRKRLADLAIFSHARHAAAKLDCASCHNDTAAGVMLKALSMKSCVDCHRSHKASIECNVCHELGQ